MNAKTTAEQRKDLKEHMDYMARRYDRHEANKIFLALLADLESAESRCRALEEVVRELLNDGDNLADAIATIYEGTIHQLNWEDTRTKARAVLSEAALAAKDQEINRLNNECGHLQADVAELKVAAATVPAEVVESATWLVEGLHGGYADHILRCANFVLSLAAKGKGGA